MSSTPVANEAGPLERYGTGQIHFAGSDSGLYERHLLFDNVIAAERTDARPTSRHSRAPGGMCFRSAGL